MCIRDSYYTDQCPYTYYWVPKVQEAAKEHGIPFKAIHITEKETAQNVPAPVTTYALFPVSYTHLDVYKRQPTAPFSKVFSTHIRPSV